LFPTDDLRPHPYAAQAPPAPPLILLKHECGEPTHAPVVIAAAVISGPFYVVAQIRRLMPSASRKHRGALGGSVDAVFDASDVCA